MASIPNRSSARGPWVVAFILVLIACLLWLPALSTPGWGDDYMFLQGARASRLGGEPWWRPFWPDVRFIFWRPLGHEVYWRFVDGILGANPLFAHLGNFILWLMGCVSIGLFGATLARSQSWDRPVLTGALTTGVFAVYAIHFTPIHWISSGDSLFIVLWSALALAVWTAAPSCRAPLRAWLCGLLPILQVLALFSKESGVLLPLLMLCVSVFAWDRSKPGRPEMIAWLSCSVLILIWLALRERFILPPMPEYGLAFGVNVLRNAAALVAWSLNLPREALRVLALGPQWKGVLWALAAALPMLGFIYLAGRPLVRQARLRQAVAVAAFVLVGYSPYFFLAWQSYEYYAQVALIMPTVLLARGLTLSNHAYVAAALFSCSSLIAIEGSRLAEDPGLIGRARWAEKQLKQLATQDVTAPLYVRVTNPHQFSAIGAAGLAWRLNLPASDIAIVDECPGKTGRLLVHRQDGTFGWVECGVDEVR